MSKLILEELQRCQNENDELTSQIEQLIRARTELRKQVMSNVSSIMDLNTEKEQLQQMLIDANGSIEKKDKALIGLQAENARLRDAIYEIGLTYSYTDCKACDKIMVIVREALKEQS